MLPHEPQSLEQIKDRFPAALETVWDARECARPGAPRPGLVREHVFDFEDGLRMIASRDSYGDDPPVIHLSFSIQEGSRLQKAALKRGLVVLGVRAKAACFLLIGRLPEGNWPVTERALHITFPDIPALYTKGFAA